MPVARIYASLVEEAEPLCADLLARGYDVEVVFPDAILPTIADLELRVERCSAEQAIARVEAAGPPSRCVFVTPAKGPRRELLLVEMTVLSTGTDGRHPRTVPVLALAALDFASIPAIPMILTPENSGPASVLPFRSAALQPPTVDASPRNGPGSELDVNVAVSERQSPSRSLGEEMFGKIEIASLNAFLAHAPQMDRAEMLPAKILKSLRHTDGFNRARNHWEGLSLMGVAGCFFLLLSIGWSAAPTRSHATPMSPARLASMNVVPKVVTQLTPSLISKPMIEKSKLSLVALNPRMQNPAPALQLRNHRPLRFHDDWIAPDRVERIGSGLSNQPHRQPSAAGSFRPAAIKIAGAKSATIKPTTIKKITDLK